MWQPPQVEPRAVVAAVMPASSFAWAAFARSLAALAATFEKPNQGQHGTSNIRPDAFALRSAPENSCRSAVGHPFGTVMRLLRFDQAIKENEGVEQHTDEWNQRKDCHCGGGMHDLPPNATHQPPARQAPNLRMQI